MSAGGALESRQIVSVTEPWRHAPPPPILLDIIVSESASQPRGRLAAALADEGHRVRSVISEAAGCDALVASPADLLVFDLGDLSAVDLNTVQYLRTSRPDLGIILCTTSLSPLDRIAGFSHGADLCLLQPVPAEELCAAVGAFARRLCQSGTVLRGMTLNVRTLQLIGPSGAVDVSKRESDILSALVVAPKALLGAATLLKTAGLPETKSGKHALEVQIVRLRKKLAQAGVTAASIFNVRRVGYQLLVAIDVLPTDNR